MSIKSLLYYCHTERESAAKQLQPALLRGSSVQPEVAKKRQGAIFGHPRANIQKLLSKRSTFLFHLKCFLERLFPHKNVTFNDQNEICNVRNMN